MHRPPLLPDTQLFLRPGIVEFGWGHPDPDLLPVAPLAEAASRALAQHGVAALSYGAEQGPGQLIELLQARHARLEGWTPAAQSILVTGGVSQALDLLCALFTRPGDAILVESPAYHLALRIFRDHDLEMVPVETDDHGLRVDALVRVLGQLRQAGRRPVFLYTVPTFCNPTTSTLPLDRRHSLATVVAGENLLLLEDDVYRELYFGAPPPPSLSRQVPEARVVRLCSFSKVLAPGLRLGWLVAPEDVVTRCVQSGVLDSGGGINHFTAHVVTAFLQAGALDSHVEVLRGAYRRRRDILCEALARELPDNCHWAYPEGGFFVWLRLPDNLNADTLLPVAEQQGVSYVPGARFFTRGGNNYLRLSFSLLEADQMTDGARRLGEVIRVALGRAE